MNRREFLGQVSAASGVLTRPAHGQPTPVTIVVPPDGGTPRDPRRILRLGDKEFRVLVVSASARGPSPRDTFDPPWRIGEFFGKGDAIDVLSQQTAVVYRSEWNEHLQCWTGDAAGVERSIAADRTYRKPVLNTENGYEYLPGYPTNRKQVYHTNRVRQAAWRIVCAGGYFAAGFISTIGHSDAWDVIDRPNRHPFLIKDAGVAAQLAALYRFFEPLPFWRMSPGADAVRGDALCCGSEGEVFVAYLPHGGAVSLKLPERGFSARWFDPRKGDFHSAAVPVSNAARMDAPDNRDWVLLIQR